MQFGALCAPSLCSAETGGKGCRPFPRTPFSAGLPGAGIVNKRLIRTASADSEIDAGKTRESRLPGREGPLDGATALSQFAAWRPPSNYLAGLTAQAWISATPADRSRVPLGETTWA